jgi:hypothetical protein
VKNSAQNMTYTTVQNQPYKVDSFQVSIPQAGSGKALAPAAPLSGKYTGQSQKDQVYWHEQIISGEREELPYELCTL